ncbi:SusC/RagA family TonB-linked outer membrane protein [Leeuwenhoekiella sp. ZYFB001]|uniref:SusC/RagA family TonB-linked outer membrane protein n=1 Tax=Leeuwenhoekiella sp. ZYFB001 TaxID=2719912 RepID=UPI0014311756|nr:SusC/RagA family TonB-linked outer membrane protein [Leeuwenhoekiella sp. ZYFB001]
MLNITQKRWCVTHPVWVIALFLLCFSAAVQAQQISLPASGTPNTLNQLVEAIEAQSDYRVVYNAGKINMDTQIAEVATPQDLTTLLKNLFKSLPYTYELKGKQVMLLQSKKRTTAPQKSRMLQGTVTDAQGNPLPGATLMVLGTGRGAMTDADGNFKYLVQAANPDAVQLEVKYLGMETQVVTLGSQSRLNIQLQEAQSELDQVVITSSYGTQKLKEEVVGSIVTVTDDEIPVEQASESIDKMLEGQVAGVLVENTSGVGEPVRIDIRGQGSLTPLNNALLGTSTQPLIIIDGVIMTEETGIDNNFFDGAGVAGESFTNPLSKIAPGDIESINVLKDAAAVGIYGADGANGVIIITTKKGKRGKTRFNFSTQLGVSEAINQIQYLSGPQYTQLRNEFLRNTGGTLLPENGIDTNWFDLLNTTGVYTKYNLSASGASERFNYRASVTYLDIDEPQMGNENKQINANINLGYDLGKLDFRLSLSPNYQQRTQPNIYYGYAFVPRLSPYNEDGSFALLGVNTVANPLAAIAQNRNDNTGYGLLGSFNVNYKVTESLKISSLFGLDYKDKEQDRYFSGANESGRGNGTFVLDGATYPRWGRRLINSRNSTRWNWQTQAFYEKQWGDHGFDVLGGLELSEEQTDLEYASGTGFTNPDRINAVADAIQDDDPDTNADDRFSNQTYRADINNSSRVSFYGQLNYDYKGKYFFLANFRRDESSVFGSDSNVAYNGGAGLSWVVSKENFLNNTPWLDFLRLRTSYGSTGNSRIGSYRALGLYNRSINSGYNGLTEATPSAAPNPQLSWERNLKYNAGLDLNLFGRLQLTAEYYYDDLRDLITSRDIPSENGFSSLQLNAAQMYNTGLEFSARIQWIDSKKFKWNTSFNIATLKNEVTDLVGLGSDYSTAARALAQRIGYSTSAIWGLNWVGIDPATGRDLIRYNDQVYDLATYRSLFTEANWEPIGDSQPDAYGGFSTSFQFGNSLSLSVRGSYQIGGEYLADYQLISQYNLTTNRNLSVNAFDYWRGPGDTSALQPLVSSSNPTTPNMSKYVYDATFVKLSNINLTYNVPVRTLRVPVDQLSVFLDVSNVAYWYKDESPEGRNGIREFRFTYPQARTISLGVKTSF